MAGSNSALTEALYTRVKEFHKEEQFPDEIYKIDIQHEDLLPKLRPYQIKAVRWMLARENISQIVSVKSDNGIQVELPKGGILADEMGLGKTVEVLACILANPIKNLDKLLSIWEENMSHIAKARECILDNIDGTQSEMPITKSSDVFSDHSYSDCKSEPDDLKPVVSTTTSSSKRSQRKVSFAEISISESVKESVEQTFSNNASIIESDDSKPVISSRSSTPRKKRSCTKNVSFAELDYSDGEDGDYCPGGRKPKSIRGKHTGKRNQKRKRKTEVDDSDFVPDLEKPGIGKKQKPTSMRAYLNSWYEAKLMETSPLYQQAKRTALHAIPDLRCCCNDNYVVDYVTRLQCPMCMKHQHSVCLGITVDEFNLDNPYLCFQCWPKQNHLVPSGATIIISPASISNQWLTEIEKHIRKSGLNVLYYEGVRVTGYLQPTTLAQYDIVITTYQVLIRELDYVDHMHSNRTLRYTKKFLAPSSPLTNVLWWRMCLDEAQMVESITTKGATMVQNLKAVNKWAVCGTPIQKSIHDLYGLVHFLQVDPYVQEKSLSRLLKNKEMLFELVPNFLWRMSKCDVIHEIGVPPQSFVQHWLKFSPVEIHFYKRQQSDCTTTFMSKLASFENLNMLVEKLDSKSTRKLLAPLLHLRQACVHPQLIKGQFVALKKTMTMEELLKFMLVKAVIDCEIALRLVISSLNGISALLVIQGEVESAVDHYRQVLHLNQEYDGRLKVDTLQKIHTLHNLADLLEYVKPNVPQTLRDDVLRQDAAALEDVYLNKRKGDITSTKRTLKSFAKKIKQQSQEKPFNNSQWWVEVMMGLEDGEEFMDRLKLQLESSKHKGVNLIAKVSSKHALIEEVWQWLANIESTRQKVLNTLEKLEHMSQDQLADAALTCHLKQKNKKQTGDKRCLLCKCETLLKSYESHLFSITNKNMPSENLDASTSSSQDQEELFDETVDEPNEEDNRIVAELKNKTMFETYNAGSWQASQQEGALKLLLYHGRKSTCNMFWLETGRKHLLLVDSIKKEFRILRLFWTQMFDHVAARDELSMAKVRLRLPYPGEKVKKSEQSIHIIEAHQVDVELVRLKNEKAAAEVDLKKKLGTLLYLQNLQKRGDGQNEVCPICHNSLLNKWSVLSCGHYLCFECVPALLNMCGGTHLVCAICRERTSYGDVSHIEGVYDNELVDDSVPIKGSHTTKIQAVIFELLKIRKQEPTVKILIFSLWERVLDVLGEAFTLNEISFRRLTTVRKQRDLALTQFKTENVTALLLPIKQGAKGLNLTEATHVFLVEPLLNPADELQAIGRVHRIGQTRETFVHRFIIRNTIEERMLSAIEVDEKDEWNKENLTISKLAELFSTNDENEDSANNALPQSQSNVDINIVNSNEINSDVNIEQSVIVPDDVGSANPAMNTNPSINSESENVSSILDDIHVDIETEMSSRVVGSELNHSNNDVLLDEL